MSREDEDRRSSDSGSGELGLCETIGVFALLTLIGGVVGLLATFILHFFVYMPIAWGLGGGVGVVFALLLLMNRFSFTWKRDARDVVVALCAIIAIIGLAGILTRHHTEAPARHVAAVAAARKAAIQEAEQHRLDAAKNEAIRQFEKDGLPVSEISYEDPVVSLRPNLRSGWIWVTEFPPVGGYNNVHLMIKRVDGTWVAGCPTVVPGVMFPLGADNNRLAIALQVSYSCPGDLSPPSPHHAY